MFVHWVFYLGQVWSHFFQPKNHGPTTQYRELLSCNRHRRSFRNFASSIPRAGSLRRRRPECPLSHAFHSKAWRVLQPIDFLIDSAFDVTSPQVQQAIGKVLPECHLVSVAIDCSTKSRICEIKLSGGRGPRPEATRVDADNEYECSDFLLAVQRVLAEHDRAVSADVGRSHFSHYPAGSPGRSRCLPLPPLVAHICLGRSNA